MRTVRPLCSNKAPSAAEVSPLPRDETTPPVTKIYFVGFLDIGDSQLVECVLLYTVFQDT